MDAKLVRPISCATTLIFFLTQAAYPQTPAPPPPTGAAAGQQETPVFKKEQIDQLLAPIALYPDDLIAMVLMASTYPTEIVMADRWVRQPDNAKLKGDQLSAALDKQTWDPSVKSLVPFPQVLQMMSEQLDWTQKLGDAMLAQQQDVMDAVQRLRKSAESAGTLQTTPQQTVTNQGDTIIIQPANPQTVYVPAYNPQTAYGTWPYPSYPPPYYPPPPAYYPAYPYGSALATGLFFGAGLAITAGLWGWGNCNWGGGNNSINIDNSRYNNINRNNINAGRAQQLQAGNGNWRHDSSHRGGTPYRDRGSQQRYQRGSTLPASSRQNFSGRTGGGNAQRASQGALGGGANRAGTGVGANRTGAGAGAGANRPAARSAGGANRPSAGAGAGAGVGARPAARSSAPAFSGMNNGSAARAQSARGNASRSSMSAGARGGGASARSAGGGARAGGGGAARAGGGGGGARGGGRR